MSGGRLTVIMGIRWMLSGIILSYSCQADVDAAVGGSLDDLYNYHPQSMEFFGNGTMYICTATSGKTSSLTHWMINYRHSATKFKTFLNLSSR
ncbi:hypothetical protein LENED_006921 [Lentinula edodes]|uniref:Uncharacterized protein n=1 Tax=Lentinula edodes TaxID=5353 RepID=A0A1Q3ED02_LENED|nr:hypothetical protein LENED_006921 [Lentinula edodes]